PEATLSFPTPRSSDLCLAELIDNSIDGFLHAARTGTPVDAPEIGVNLPTADNEDARVVVKDNGPGMSFELLENAVKAGWSGNSPDRKSTRLNSSHVKI